MKFKNIKPGTIFLFNSILYIKIELIYTDYGCYNTVRILDGTIHFISGSCSIELGETTTGKTSPGIRRYSYYVEK